MTLKPDNYSAFKTAFDAEVVSSLPPQLKTPEIHIDFELDLSKITPKFYRILSQFAPFGPENMAPVFSTTAVYDSGYGKCVGQDDKHLKISVNKNNTISLNSIGFGLGSKLALVQNKMPFDIAYTIEENEWKGQVSLQLKLKDIKP